MKKGIVIEFKGLSFRERLSIWWTFTQACLFHKETETKFKVKRIDVFT